jgi:hypothetical protein
MKAREEEMRSTISYYRGDFSLLKPKVASCTRRTGEKYNKTLLVYAVLPAGHLFMRFQGLYLLFFSSCKPTVGDEDGREEVATKFIPETVSRSLARSL